MIKSKKYQLSEEHVDAQKLVHANGRDSFYVNSTCIYAKNQIINKGQSYILFDIDPYDNRLKTYPVVLMSIYVIKNKVEIILSDILTGNLIQMEHILDHGESQCQWMLFDVDYFNRRLKKR